MPQNSFWSIWELFMFGQILAHEAAKSPGIDKGFLSKFRFESMKFEHEMLEKTFAKSIFSIHLCKTHHKP